MPDELPRPLNELVGLLLVRGVMKNANATNYSVLCVSTKLRIRLLKNYVVPTPRIDESCRYVLEACAGFSSYIETRGLMLKEDDPAYVDAREAALRTIDDLEERLLAEARPSSRAIKRGYGW